jgi:hypothetical protein
MLERLNASLHVGCDGRRLMGRKLEVGLRVPRPLTVGPAKDRTPRREGVQRADLRSRETHSVGRPPETGYQLRGNSSTVRKVLSTSASGSGQVLTHCPPTYCAIGTNVFPPRSPAIATTVGFGDGAGVATATERLARLPTRGCRGIGFASCIVGGRTRGFMWSTQLGQAERVVATRTRGHLRGHRSSAEHRTKRFNPPPFSSL